MENNSNISTEGLFNLFNIFSNNNVKHIDINQMKNNLEMVNNKDELKPINKHVFINNDVITVKGLYIGKNYLSKYIGNDDKIDALFNRTPGFFLRTAEVPLFFKFELIKFLQRASKFRYDIDIETVDAILKELIIPPTEINKVFDYKYIENNFNYKILEHQQKIIDKCLENKFILDYRGTLVHAAPGSGKTSTALFLVNGLRKYIDNVIILCPLPTLEKVWIDSLTNNTFKEPQSYYNINSSKPYSGEKYIVCHYEGLNKLQPLLNKLPKGKTAVIIDECHNVTEIKSNRTNLCLNTVNTLECNDVILLSGTPLKSGIAELITIFKYLDKSLNDPKLEKRFYTLYKSPTDFMSNLLKERYNNATVIVPKDVLKLDPIEVVNLKIDFSKNDITKYSLDNIRKELKEYVTRRKKEIEDTKSIWTNNYITLRDKAYELADIPSKERKEYESNVDIIKNTPVKELFTITTITKAANDFEKLRLLPVLNKEEKVLFKEAKSLYKYPVLKITGEALGNVIGRARIECHKQLAIDLNYISILQASKKKVIFFSNYVEVCKTVQEQLIKAGYTSVGVYGETTKDLAKHVSDFTNNKKIDALVTTYQSLSTGTPLVAASTIVCVDLPFRMHIYDQAIARAWRLGQDTQVTVFILQINTDIPTINSRNVDIITFFKNEVEVITGVKYSTELDVSTEEYKLLDEIEEDEESSISNESLSLSTEAKNPKRKQVEDIILKYIDKIVTGKTNTQLYQELFNSMNDKEFDQLMQDLRDGRKTLSIIVPNNDSKYKVTVENNIKLANELGYNFFQKLNVGATEDRPAYTTPNEYMVIKLPIRRAAQLLTKKISIPEDASHIDFLSGQVTGVSKGSKLTNPELQVLAGIGLKDSIVELMKGRGGDLGASAAMDASLIKYGSVRQDTLEQYSTEVVSKKSLKAYFNAMHIKNTL